MLNSRSRRRSASSRCFHLIPELVGVPGEEPRWSVVHGVKSPGAHQGNNNGHDGDEDGDPQFHCDMRRLAGVEGRWMFVKDSLLSQR